MTGEVVITRSHPLHVITGLVPVIPIVWNAPPHRIGTAGHDVGSVAGRESVTLRAGA